MEGEVWPYQILLRSCDMPDSPQSLRPGSGIEIFLRICLGLVSLNPSQILIEEVAFWPNLDDDYHVSTHVAAKGVALALQG